MQETLLRVWSRGWLPADPGPALLYLVRCSSLHQARCRRRRTRREAEAATDRSPCCADDPLAALEAADRRRALEAALGCLRREYRAVFELFELEERPYESIAADLGIAVGTVRSRLHRARALLRRSLRRHGPACA